MESIENMESVMKEPVVIKAGRMEFAESLELQHRCRRQVRAGTLSGVVILTEHEPVVTLGRRGNRAHLRVPDAALPARGVKVFHLTRGGHATAHEPGQLVIYWILPVPDKGAAPFVAARVAELRRLIRDNWGVETRYDPARPGLWVENKKVASLGFDLTGGVSMHGAAVNVCNSLETFAFIDPCGDAGTEITTLCRITEEDPDMERALRDAEAWFRTNGSALFQDIQS